MSLSTVDNHPVLLSDCFVVTGQIAAASIYLTEHITIEGYHGHHPLQAQRNESVIWQK